MHRSTSRLWPTSVLSVVGAFAFALSAIGCGGEDGVYECNGGGSGNTLSGSYCEGEDIVFTTVYLLLVDSDASKTLRIEYINGDRTNKTLRVLFTPPQEASVTLDEEINLVSAGAVVQRFSPQAAEPINLTADLESTSNIKFSTYDEVIGGSVVGAFNLLFKTGRTLKGEFEGTVEDALTATDIGG